MYRLLRKIDNELHNLLIEGDGGLILEANDPLNYEFGKANKTYSISILNTYHNNLLLDNLFNKSFDYTVCFKDCYLQVEDNMFFEGVVYIIEFNKRFARVQFISSNISLFESLSNTNLRDINYGLTHDVTYDNVNASRHYPQLVNTDPKLLNNEVLYDFIDRGKTQYHENSPASNPELYAKRVTIGECFPAIRTYEIFEKIFNGYNITGNHFEINKDYKKFGDSFLLHNTEYLIYTGSNIGVSGNPDDWDRMQHFIKHKYDDGTPISGAFGLIVIINTTTSGTLTQELMRSTRFDFAENDPKGMLDVNNKIEIKESGVYNVEFKFFANTEITSGIPRVERDKVFMQIYKNGTLIKKDVTPTLTTSDNLFIEGDVEFYATTGNAYFEERDVIHCTLNILNSINQTTGTATLTFDKRACFGKATINTSIGENMTLDVAKIMPNMTAGSFVKAYLKEFCLHLFVSMEKKEVIFYKQQGTSPEVVDLTGYVVDGTLIVTPNFARNNLVLRRKISDEKLQQLVKDNPDLNIDRAKRINNNSKATDTIESEFSQTLHFENLRFENKEFAQIWSSYDPINPNEVPSLSMGGGLRILYISTNLPQGFSKTIQERQGATVSPVLSPCPLFKTSNELIDANYDADLYDNYHKDNINNLLFGHELECELALPESFVNGIYYLTEGSDWRNKFIINVDGFKGYYRLRRLERKEGNVYKGIFYKDLS